MVLVIACAIGLLKLSMKGGMHEWTSGSLDPYLIQQPLNLVAALIIGTAVLVTLFYCVEALHGERSDRSILFWKSLPISDLATVLSKVGVILIIPLICFAVVYATQIVLLLLSSLALLAHGQGIGPLWTNLSLVQMPLMVLYHMVTMHVLWYAPIYAWLLLVSAWARRAPFLWAVLPPVGIGVFESIAFHTSYFRNMLLGRLGGDPGGSDMSVHVTNMDPLMHITPLHFLLSPGLWIGFLIAGLLLAAAVRVRRSHGPI